MTYSDVEEIAKGSGVRFKEELPQYGFADEDAFKTWIETYVIPLVEGAVNDFCHVTWTESTAPAVVKQIANWAGQNYVKRCRADAMGPFQRVAEFTLATPEVEILTAQMKEMLGPYVEYPSVSDTSEYMTYGIRETWGED
jgi:hypothetical protein